MSRQRITGVPARRPSAGLSFEVVVGISYFTGETVNDWGHLDERKSIAVYDDPELARQHADAMNKTFMEIDANHWAEVLCFRKEPPQPTRGPASSSRKAVSASRERSA
jgi:hypothetical protein